jgi:hypothetical protein
MLSYTENAASLLQTIPYPSAHQSLLRPPTVGLRDWRRDLSESDRGLVEVLAGHELRALGYSVSRVPVWSRVRALVVRIRFLALSARSRYRLRRSARAKVRR